ncbi:MAG: outer membrane beta-barrel protein [Alphaproteobacteria bacterium]|nr:outer membrane beta-barrel protein [Alphaproteobacteria bacterium]
MGMSTIRVLAAGAVVAGCLAPILSYAQTPERGVTVTERQRPDLDPLGVRAGGFLVMPKLKLDGVYDDNVFATDNNTVDDFIAVISPSLRATSDWNTHSLEFHGGADVARYMDQTDEDYIHYNLGTSGRLDIRRDTNVSAGVDFVSTTEDRGSPDDANGIEPTEYTLLTPRIGAFNRWNRVSLDVGAEAQIYDFDDVARAGGAIANNDDRDRTRYLLSMQGEYEIVPQYAAFLRVELNQVDYDSGVDDNGVNRDSDGYEVVAGTRVDLTGVLFGDVFAGYRSQSYDDPSLSTVDGISYGGALTWNVTELTTVKGSIARTVEESTLQGASGYLATAYTASVDHELLRNLLVGFRAGLTNNDYEGISREDDVYTVGAYGRYLMQRNLYLSLNYNYTNRDSSVSGADYEKNVIMLRVETQL